MNVNNLSILYQFYHFCFEKQVCQIRFGHAFVGGMPFHDQTEDYVCLTNKLGSSVIARARRVPCQVIKLPSTR
jgi:hypothetical protein